MTKPHIAGLAAVFCCLMWLPCHCDDQPQKLALLVGVSDYFHKNMEDLNYAENDVVKVGDALKRLGFKVTTLTGREATKKSVDEKLEQFLASTSKLENDDIVFVMFSGHGQQLMAVQQKKVIVDDQVRTIRQKIESPFFCPRNAIPYDRLEHELAGKTEEQIADELNLVPLNRVIAGLDKRSNSRQNLLVVDACRNNPAKGKTANITGSTTKELPNGLSILFAAKSGQKSWESSDSKIKHGVMSHFLIEGLKGKATNRRNVVTWKRLVAYVAEEVDFDAGKLAGASDRKQNPHNIDSSSTVIVLGTPFPSKLSAGSYTKRDIDAARSAWAAHLGVKGSFKNSLGMEMVLIPPGEFTFGNPYTDNELAKMTGEEEKAISDALGKWDNKSQKNIPDDFRAGRPSRKVSLNSAFYLCKTEVTLELFRQFIKETGHVSKDKGTDILLEDGEWVASGTAGTGSWNESGINLHEKSAVRNVDSVDTEKFCQWLSKKTGQRFRLPTETEWEYVCKSGSKERWAADYPSKRIDSFVPKLKSGNHLPSVGAGAENVFGICDMHFGASELCTADPMHSRTRSSVFIKKGGKGPVVKNEYYFSRFSFTRDTLFTTIHDGFRVVCEVPN